MAVNYFVHESSYVDENVTIGEGVRIWHFCHIMSNAVIGENSILGQNVFVGASVKLGNRNKIQNNVSVYSGVETEDDVFMGPSAVFTNVINPRSAIERKEEFKKTLLKKGVSIGANATILCGIEVGSYAMIGAGSVVTKDVPPFAIIKGNPGKIGGWISKAGYKLKFINNEASCPGTGEKYILKENLVHLF